MKSGKQNKPKFSFDYFFFGYASESNARFGHLVKRILWLLIVFAGIKYWIEALWGLLIQKNMECLIFVFPAIIATAIAVLFFNFD